MDHTLFSQVKNISVSCFNSNTFTWVVGKMQKKLSPEGGREGGAKKKKKHAQGTHRGQGSNPGPTVC